MSEVENGNKVTGDHNMVIQYYEPVWQVLEWNTCFKFTLVFHYTISL